MDRRLVSAIQRSEGRTAASANAGLARRLVGVSAYEKLRPKGNKPPKKEWEAGGDGPALAPGFCKG